MADSSRIANAFGCIMLLTLFTLCGGCLYSCRMVANQQLAAHKSLLEREEALINDYAPQLLPALRDCEEQIQAWNEDVATLSQTIARVGKDPRKDKDVQEATRVIQELMQVHSKLNEAKGDLLIALTKTQLKTGKGSEEERLRRAQKLVASAITESEKAVRIARARQRQIDGAIDPSELVEGLPNRVEGELEGPTNKSPMSQIPESPPFPTSSAEDTPSSSVADALPGNTSPSAPLPSVGPRPRVPETPAEQVNSVGQRLKLIPAGEFAMGADPPEIDAMLTNSGRLAEKFREKFKERLRSELPQHDVKIQRAFYMGATEVTFGQFKQFVDDSGYATTAESQSSSRNWRRVGYDQADNYPVTAVSWIDAVEFCKWLSEKEQAKYRLPTEAEWEYACRAGSESSWFWGDDAKRLGEFAWSALDSPRKPGPVATKSPNAFGLFDMQGNVSEWCHDWYSAGYYAAAPINDPAGPNSGEDRVVRGGSVLLDDPGYFRSTLRGGFRPASELVGIGFRVVRDTEQLDDP